MKWEFKRINKRFYYQGENGECVMAEIRDKDHSTYWIEESGNISKQVLKKFCYLMKKQYNLKYYLLGK